MDAFREDITYWAFLVGTLRKGAVASHSVLCDTCKRLINRPI